MAASLAALIADGADEEGEAEDAAQPAAASAPATARQHPRVALDRSFRRPSLASTYRGSRRIMPTTLLHGVVDGPGGVPLGDRLRLPRQRLVRLVADDHAAAVPPGEVAPGQVDQRRDPVPAAEQIQQVQAEPGQPRERPGEPR